MESKFKLPTETVELPSKGMLYPQDSALAKGTLEMKYMTAKEEDILTNQNYLLNGEVIDKLLQSLIVTEGVDYGELLVGDKNALLIAARILSYGKDYEFTYSGEEIIVDLTTIQEKQVNIDLSSNRDNEFTFILPSSQATITFKLLTHRDEQSIKKEIEGLKKLNKTSSTQVTTRLKYLITSVNGDRDSKTIREFIDNYLLAKDARALREEYTNTAPDVVLKFTYTDNSGREEEVDLPIGISFFWPDA